MKGIYLVHITLPDYFDQNFYRMLPEQKRRINKLMEKRVVLSYSMDMERKNVWMFFESENEQKLMDILSTFPIISKVKINIQELAFMEAAPSALPDLILN